MPNAVLISSGMLVTGEIIDAVSILSLDIDKINEDIGLMEYYTIMTSEVEIDNHEVIDEYHGLSRIEAAFRIIKSDLKGSLCWKYKTH